MPEKFTLVRKGYDPAAVDEYVKRTDEHIEKLQDIARDYKTEFEEMEESVNAYKEKETAINNAFVNAQISADNILADAKSAAEDIIGDARAQAQKINDAAERHLAELIRSIAPQRIMLQNFKHEYDALITRHLKNLADNEFALLEDKINSLEAYLQGLQIH